MKNRNNVLTKVRGGTSLEKTPTAITFGAGEVQRALQELRAAIEATKRALP
jgi:hypothetical protein